MGRLVLIFKVLLGYYKKSIEIENIYLKIFIVKVDRIILCLMNLIIKNWDCILYVFG